MALTDKRKSFIEELKQSKLKHLKDDFNKLYLSSHYEWMYRLTQDEEYYNKYKELWQN